MENDCPIVGPAATAESILAVLEILERVEKQAIEFDRRPLALLATCKLCGRITESFSLHRMDPAPRHHDDCVLYGFTDSGEVK